MEIEITDKAQQDLQFWKKSGNESIQAKISNLLQSIAVSPYEGLRKPEPLKYELGGMRLKKIR